MALAAASSRRRNPPLGGRLDPICRTCTRAQDRCLLPSPGLAFHIGRPEGSTSSPQTACIRRGSSAAPLRHGACSYPGRRCTGSSCRERPASNSTVQARGVVLRGGPGSSALRHANPDGPPLPPSALSTAPSRTSGERAQALEEGWGWLPIWISAGKRTRGWRGSSRRSVGSSCLERSCAIRRLPLLSHRSAPAGAVVAGFLPPLGLFLSFYIFIMDPM